MERQDVPVPDPFDGLFEEGITHPELWLWDSWTVRTPDGCLHLYCLALSRKTRDGLMIPPSSRNDYPFHVRHFVSSDQGSSWTDHGYVINPGHMPDGADGSNVWSGSILTAHSGRVLFGYTGIRDISERRPFLQSICVGQGDTPDAMNVPPDAAISCPLRDYQQIISLGYYLGPFESLGDELGEEGGPILAWRDPFLVRDTGGELYAFWSAKIAPTVPAIARARLIEGRNGVELVELMKPVTLPDASEFTQSELPKLYFDKSRSRWLMLISACDRMYEGQPDCEVSFQQRLYVSSTISGPWAPAFQDGSVLNGLDLVFGASLVGRDIANKKMAVLGPFTEQAGEARQLSFPPIRYVDGPV